MKDCTFDYDGGTLSMQLDPTVLQAIKTRKMNGIRNPRKSQLLGLIGEHLALTLLKYHGFSAVEKLPTNHPDADLIADRDGERFFISVKARNKFQNNGTLNSRYKLESKRRKLRDALKAAQEHNAKFAWFTVQIDKDTNSAWFGTHEDLCKLRPLSPPATGVLMSTRWTNNYEELASNQRHDLQAVLFSNRSMPFAGSR
jgi:Holliday junction resolvase-like predicted endonuclease